MAAAVRAVVAVKDLDGDRPYRYLPAARTKTTLRQPVRVGFTDQLCLMKTRSDFADDEFRRKRYSDWRLCEAAAAARRQTRESTISSSSCNCDSVPVETRRVQEIIVATMRPRGCSDSAVR